ncbi:MAG: hypothetical protein AAF911_11600 [Planctomycetota bacterium]
MAKRKPHEKVETWIVVTIISVLVWLYAEATVLQERSGQSLQLRITEATENYAITPDAATVRVSYRASSGQIQQFNDTAGVPLIHEIDVTDVTEKTERTLILDEVLIRAGLGDIGITELTVEPETINVTIQPLETIELPVVVQSEAGLNISGEPQPDPAFVTVTAPQEIIDGLRDQAVVEAQLIPTNAGEGTGLERIEPNVALRYPDILDLRSSWVTAPVRDVRVNYRLENETDEFVVDTVPLFVNLPVDVQRRYTVAPEEPSPFLLDVGLQGPADTIARIRNGEIDIRAELIIPDVSRIEQTRSVTPVLILPPGVTAVRPPGAMRITVLRREAPAGG